MRQGRDVGKDLFIPVGQTIRKGEREVGLWKKLKGIINHPMVEYGGNYQSFAEAAKECEGYDAEAIFEKVKQSAMAVVCGEACFERDSFLFYEKEINYNLMMYMQKRYIEDGYLKVCDWGGALGSTYLQHRELLEQMNCGWDIVEQKHFVEFGKENIHVPGLQFCEALQDEGYNCVLFSGVLQYLENAREVITEAVRKRPGCIIVERTPVSNLNHIWVERVHEPIYEGSYALIVYEEKGFLDMFCSDGTYRLVDSWHSLVDGDEQIDHKHKVQFKSFVFERKE